MMRLLVPLLASGIMLLSLGATPAYAQVTCGPTYTVQSGNNLTDIAEACGVSLSDLISANPQISNPNVIYPGQVLNIPGGVSIPVTGGATYVVQYGDSLSSIASRYGVSLTAMLNANPQISNPNLIYPGQVINLPSGALSIPVTGGSVYVVQNGDTLSSIASRYGITLTTLLDANPGLTSGSLVYPGETLNLPVNVAPSNSNLSASVSPAAGTRGTTVNLSASGFAANQDVVIGFGMANNVFYQVTTATTDSNGNLSIQVTVPSWPTVDGYYYFTVQVANDANIRAISNVFYLSGTGNTGTGSVGIPVTGGASVYTVQPGDSLAKIAQLYNTTIADLLAWNPQITNENLIYPGEQIQIPGAGESSAAYVVLSTQVASPGMNISVHAYNFPANAAVDVRIAQSGEKFTGVVDASSNSQGEVISNIQVPSSAAAGQTWIVIVTTTELNVGTTVDSAPISIVQ